MPDLDTSAVSPEPLTEHGARRRTALTCMAWAGAGMLWTLNAGVPGSKLIGGTAQAAEVDRHAFSFVQISDSHIGFSKDPNLDPTSTLQEAVDKNLAPVITESYSSCEPESADTLRPQRIRCRPTGASTYAAVSQELAWDR